MSNAVSVLPVFIFRFSLVAYGASFLQANRFLSIQIDGFSCSKSRQRRYLIFTPATQYGVLATVAIPINSETAVSVGWFFEANYFTVDNATWYEPLLGDISISRNREKRSSNEPNDAISRTTFYTFIEGMLEKHGYAGRACLLRAICENAVSHFLHNGLLGDLLHFTLTPSMSMAETDLEDCFYEAEYLGNEGLCMQYEELCSESPLDAISLYVEQNMN